MFVLGALIAASGAQAQLVRCESVAGSGQRCPAAVANGVSLARQLGGSACTLGLSWGWDASGIWVKENCRGDFRLARDPNLPEQRLVCDSDHKQPKRCKMNTTAGFVIVPHDSSRKCEAGKTWGWSVGSVWVSGSCRGSFSQGPVELGRALRCEAPGSDRVICALDVSGGVTLEQEHRPTKCEYGSNWGLDKDGVWVDPPCGATFRADGRLRGTPGWSQPNELACESFDGARQFCPADTSDGVTMEREAKGSRCDRDQSWGFDAHGIWVNQDCRALFRLGK
jgi:Protein of unknown function (DUF3011)